MSSCGTTVIAQRDFFSIEKGDRRAMREKMSRFLTSKKALTSECMYIRRIKSLHK